MFSSALSDASAIAKSRRRTRRRLGIALAFGLFFPLSPVSPDSKASADDQTVVRIEEDWQIELGIPSPKDHAPQIVTVLSPRPTLDHEYSVFELNHVTYPEYFAGGLQLQSWRGTRLSRYGSSPRQQLLQTADEKISFTSAMTLDDEYLQFEIVDGSSQTWSSFGGQGYLRTRGPTALEDLSGYSPDVSVKNSRVAFASHRVRKLMLVEVRYYTEAGLLTKDETLRVVHEYSPQ